MVKKVLCNDLKKHKLVKQELTNAAGYIVLKGGRFAALASALLQVGKHIYFITKKESDDLDKYIQETVDKTLE